MVSYNPDYNYRVAPGHTIRLPRPKVKVMGPRLNEGQHIDPELFPVKDMEHLVESGFAVAVEVSPYARGGRLYPIGKFKLDPDLLQEMSLEQLNVRIQEIDPEKKPAEKENEAIAILSQDFLRSLEPADRKAPQEAFRQEKDEATGTERPSIFSREE